MAYSAEESSPAAYICDSCCICDEEFMTESDLANHLLEHADDEEFQAGLEEAEKKSQNNVQNNNILTGRPMFPEFTRTSFVREPPLKKAAVVKPTVEPEVWEIVSDDSDDDKPKNPKQARLSSSFRLVSSANNQVNSVQPAQTNPPFNCNICSTVFNDAKLFREHMATHDKPRPYDCHICKKSFAYKGTLRQHLHLHIGEKSHECKVCHKKFTIKSLLRKHEESHGMQHFNMPNNA